MPDDEFDRAFDRFGEFLRQIREHPENAKQMLATPELPKKSDAEPPDERSFWTLPPGRPTALEIDDPPQTLTKQGLPPASIDATGATP